MHLDYKSTYGQCLKVDWPRWVFSAKLDSNCNGMGCMIKISFTMEKKTKKNL